MVKYCAGSVCGSGGFLEKLLELVLSIKVPEFGNNTVFVRGMLLHKSFEIWILGEAISHISYHAILLYYYAETNKIIYESRNLRSITLQPNLDPRVSNDFQPQSQLV